MSNSCNLCPRNCGVDRSKSLGFCKMPYEIRAARAALHFWEEPCISGSSGSGTVFFSGCTLKCVYCQNYDIAHENFGKEITEDKLCSIFLNLQSQGANNINLVTPTHYADKICRALRSAKTKGLCIPVVYNTSGYEKEETLLMLKDAIDVFMPDFKYWESKTALKYSNAENYPQVAKKAIDTMVKLQPELVFNNKNILQKGVIVRILLLPGHVYEAKRILEYLYSTYGDRIIISLMSQYTPVTDLIEYPEINRTLKKKEYKSLIDYAIGLGIENVYIQDGKAADESFIPLFTLEGLN